MNSSSKRLSKEIKFEKVSVKARRVVKRERLMPKVVEEAIEWARNQRKKGVKEDGESKNRL